MPGARASIFTPRFFLMCGFVFTTFLSAFQLFPTAPFRILDLGGDKAAAGLFLGFLTYGSAATAPLTGALADRVGRRRILVAASLGITAFAVAYAFVPTYRGLFPLVLLHGLFWSALLSASSASLLELIPEGRHAEGLGYSGLATVLAVAVAPTLGLFVYHEGGWRLLCGEIAVLNLAMAAIASTLPESGRAKAPAEVAGGRRGLVEWRILAVATSLFLASFGHGGVTSFVALFAEANGVAPKGIYFTVFALVILVTRPLLGPLADRVGHRRVLLPCLLAVSVGLAMLALSAGRLSMVASAVVYGAGLGSLYPIFAAHALKTVDPSRRGAAFGSILAAFDTGVGTGSIVVGALVERFGFRAAFGSAAGLAILSIPAFVLLEKRFLTGRPPDAAAASPSV